ncbi:Snail 2 [Cichlidogyrus casuarinus]|uniref:Snail 2 n=1 Tax=Cichlidogyrus casuarinus TaxID=1844966 RepID=A0ABD2QCC1_9PLAT
MLDFQAQENTLFYHKTTTNMELEDQNLAHYVLLTSMRKLDQGRRSRAGIKLKRGLLIAVTAIKARQTLWEQELKLRKLYHQPVTTEESYTPVCTPVSPEKPKSCDSLTTNLTITIPTTEPSSFVPHFSPQASSMLMELEQSHSITNDSSPHENDDDNLDDDSLSDQSSTDEDLLPDEAMDKMVHSTISETQENERWKLSAQTTDYSVCDVKWAETSPILDLDQHSQMHKKRRLTYSIGELSPDPFELQRSTQHTVA